MPKIFFSYATEDLLEVTRFVEAFTHAGVEVLIDRKQIAPGNSIPEKIDQMIEQSNGAVIFLSGKYATKPWTSEEQAALVGWSVARQDYQLVVVRLDETLPGALLRHRLWTGGDKVEALAAAFSGALASEADASASGPNELLDWVETFSDDEISRMGEAIKQWLQMQPRATEVPWTSRQAGEVVIHLALPVLPYLNDTVAFNLNLMKKLNFIRTELLTSLYTENLGVSKAAFLLAVQEKLDQFESMRRELRETLDALIAKIMIT